LYDNRICTLGDEIMGLKPPAPQNLKKRLDFFLAHLDFPKARWEIFDLKNKIINRDYLNRKISQAEYIKRMDELDRTQGLPEPKESVDASQVDVFKKFFSGGNKK
jgi:hypothetical protein